MSPKTKNSLIVISALAVVSVVMGFVNPPAIKETEVFNIPKIYVHIKGAVKSPGIYELDSASRVNDAIVAAGGALDSADLDAVNLARFVEDGEEIFIPQKNTENEPAIYNEQPKKVNINTADIYELCKIDGIGDFVADRIVRYRNEHGNFLVEEEIMNVSGISEALFEQIRNKICVN